MPEILTESFCERCGTRYTFESAAPRAARLSGLKVVSRGLRNFVMSDDTSMDEAMAAARNETDREVTSHQLDAFHKTFNFCMTCRQYTCGNCWNETEGRCLSCAPHLGHEITPAPFLNLGAGGAVTLTDSETIGLRDHNGHDQPTPLEHLAWPSSDLMQEDLRAAEVTPIAEPAPVIEDDTPVLGAAAPVVEEPTPIVEEPTPIVETAPIVEAEAVTEPVARPPMVDAAPVTEVTSDAAPPSTVATPGAGRVEDQAAVASANTSELLLRFRPGESIDEEIEAFEHIQGAVETADQAPASDAAREPVDPEPAVVAAAPEPEPVAAAEPLPEPVLAPEPLSEPVAAAAELEPEWVAAKPAPDAEPVVVPEPVAPEPVVAAPEPEPVAAPPAVGPEPEPILEPEPLPEPVAAATELESGSVTEETRDDLVMQPTWHIVAPDAPTVDGVPAPTTPIPPPSVPADTDAIAEPDWPTQPEWPGQSSAAGLPFLGRPAAATGGMEALWAESAREVTNVAPAPGPKAAGGVQPCVNCGLSLSANARFCRRCGTRQD